MEVRILDNPGQLESAPPFRITHLLWGTQSIPETYGYIGLIPGDGFYLKMVCMEADPLRTYTEDQSPVCMDSTVEAFFNFTPENGGEPDSPAPVYVNFEINSNGALLAESGTGRRGRTPLPENEMKKIRRRAQIEEDRWSISLYIPLTVLESIYGPLSLEKGSRFTCNFYKICETAGKEHYASWSPVLTEEPDFHCPEYFGTAKLISLQS